jgi:hypothetical protein
MQALIEALNNNQTVGLWILNTLLALEIFVVIYICNYAVNVTDNANTTQSLNAFAVCLIVVNVFYTFVTTTNLIFQMALQFNRRYNISDLSPAFADVWK